MTNLFTEEEAKDKVCPQAIHMLGMQPLINCLGGGCMGWKWKPKEYIGTVMGKDMFSGKDNVGYCGLGGKP